jgi:hypothetical protein
MQALAEEKERTVNRWKIDLHAATSPSAMPTNSSRPVSGLARGLDDLGGSPSHVETQWLCDPPQLAYRCGGSAGIAL